MKNKIKRLLLSQSFTFISIFIGSFFLLEFSLRLVTALPSIGSIWENFLFLLILSTLYYYSTKLGKLLLASFFIASLALQIPHSVFYGNWIDSTNILLMTKNISEVISVSLSVPFSVVLTCLLFFSAVVGLFSLLRRYENKAKPKIWVTIIVIFIFTMQPIRDGLLKPEKIEKRYTKDVHGLFQSSHNTYGVLLSTLINQAFGEQRYPDYTQESKKLDTNNKYTPNILLYFGESLSSKYMNVFGYHKENTPNLKKLKKQYPYTIFKETISASTATAVSSSHFFHMIPFPDGRKQIGSSKTNLFKYAKNNGYSTTYLSTQAENYINHILRNSGSNSIDISITPSRFLPSDYHFKEEADDLLLLQMLATNPSKTPFFTVLQPNGSHAPISKRSPIKHKPFGSENTLNEYENSVFHTDFIIGKLISFLPKNNKPWLFIMTSDHGTYVNTNQFTRSIQYEESYTVPFVAITNNEDIYRNYLKPLEKCEKLFHINISELTAKALGYKLPYSSCSQGVLTSGLLSGIGGTRKVSIKEGKTTLTDYIPNMTQ
jgi:glucan phosphoethanolaminetransferase (alkaline phosphatase superfamily)